MSGPLVTAAFPPPDAADVLAAAREALRSLHPRPDRLVCSRPQLVSGRAVIHFFGEVGGPPLFVAKILKPDTGSAADQYAVLKRCRDWWANENRHAVVEPLALMRDGDGFLMSYVPGDSLSWVLPRAALRPNVAIAAAMAAGDFLRRFHQRAGPKAVEVDLADLVADIRAVQTELQAARMSLPARVERVLHRTLDVRLPGRRVLLHGDFTPRNLILTQRGQITMIDPLLEQEGLIEDDIAMFLAVMSSASAFAAGLVSARRRRLRLQLERAFIDGYGSSGISPVICSLRLICEQMWRWRFRRLRELRPDEERLLAVRAGVIDAQMRSLLEESAAALERALDDHLAAA